VGDIGEHLLEKVWSISVARSSETGLRTGVSVAGRNWQAAAMAFLWILGNETEGEKAWELVCGGRCDQGSFYRSREGGEKP
jgi:hypothetical protein